MLKTRIALLSFAYQRSDFSAGVEAPVQDAPLRKMTMPNTKRGFPVIFFIRARRTAAAAARRRMATASHGERSKWEQHVKCATSPALIFSFLLTIVSCGCNTTAGSDRPVLFDAMRNVAFTRPF